MTEKTTQEYLAIQRTRYRRAKRRERGTIIDEVVAVTGWHRKSAIRRLNGHPRLAKERAGRPVEYGAHVGDALLPLWRASGELSSILLHPFLPDLIASLKRHGDLVLDPAVEAQVLTASRATVERLLAPRRPHRQIHGQSMTRPGTLLRHQIPVCTWSERKTRTPGHVGIDLVGHGGDSAEGFFLFTLSMVDPASGWTELEPVWGKGKVRVRSGVHRARMRLPYVVQSIHSDNGSEFINHPFAEYCRQESLAFTRTRPYRKNDNAHTEQKNGALVRRLIGYDRYTSHAARDQLERVYTLVRLRSNYFQPQQHLIEKTREGAKVRKRYDRPRTPLERVLASGVLDEETAQRLRQERDRHSPLQLTQQIERELDRLWDLAAPRPYGAAGRKETVRSAS